MAIVAGYLVLSLPFSIVAIVRPRAAGPRLLLIILDTVSSLNAVKSTSHSEISNPQLILTKKNLYPFLAGGTDSKHCCWCCSCCHSLLGPQWQLEHKLACYLPTVW